MYTHKYEYLDLLSSSLVPKQAGGKWWPRSGSVESKDEPLPNRMFQWGDEGFQKWNTPK